MARVSQSSLVFRCTKTHTANSFERHQSYNYHHKQFYPYSTGEKAEQANLNKRVKRAGQKRLGHLCHCTIAYVVTTLGAHLSGEGLLYDRQENVPTSCEEPASSDEETCMCS